MFHTLLFSFLLCSGMTIPEEDTEAGQTGKYCLVAIGRLQVCGDTNNLNTLIKWKEWLCLCVFMYSMWTEHLSL